MNIEHDFEYFRDNLSIHINDVFSQERCNALISKYEGDSAPGHFTELSEQIMAECASQVFIDDIDALIRDYFQSDYRLFCVKFDVVDSLATSYVPHTFWHLDGGVPKTLKLFIYLNPVSEHGGNTLVIDQHRTEVLRKAEVLPIETDRRKNDLTEDLIQLGLDTDVLSYDLKAGDALLFNPLVLAHRCLPPVEGKKRYTICFTLFPEG